MKAVTVTGPGKAEVLDAERPQAGPDDVLVRMRACGICGSDAFYITIGGVPPRQGHTPLGHEPAGEVVEVGANVSGVAVGDHVVINPMAAPGGIIGRVSLGGMHDEAEYSRGQIAAAARAAATARALEPLLQTQDSGSFAGDSGAAGKRG